MQCLLFLKHYWWTCVLVSNSRIFRTSIRWSSLSLQIALVICASLIFADLLSANLQYLDSALLRSYNSSYLAFSSWTFLFSNEVAWSCSFLVGHLSKASCLPCWLVYSSELTLLYVLPHQYYLTSLSVYALSWFKYFWKKAASKERLFCLIYV